MGRTHYFLYAPRCDSKSMSFLPFPASLLAEGFQQGRNEEGNSEQGLCPSFHAGRLSEKNASSCLMCSSSQVRWLALFSFQSKHKLNFSMTGNKEVWLSNTKVYWFFCKGKKHIGSLHLHARPCKSQVKQSQLVALLCWDIPEPGS